MGTRARAGRVYYDPALATGLRCWVWCNAIGVLDRANQRTYGRVRDFLWRRWHAAYLARQRADEESDS